MLLWLMLLGSFWFILVFAGLAERAEKDVYLARQQLKRLKREQEQREWDERSKDYRGEK